MHKRCCFAGHSKIYHTDDIYDNLVNIIEKLITEENVSEFWVGNYGNFDGLSAKAVRCLKEKFPEPVVGKLDTTTIVNEDEFQKKKVG